MTSQLFVKFYCRFVQFVQWGWGSTWLHTLPWNMRISSRYPLNVHLCVDFPRNNVNILLDASEHYGYYWSSVIARASKLLFFLFLIFLIYIFFNESANWAGVLLLMFIHKMIWCFFPYNFSLFYQAVCKIFCFHSKVWLWWLQ